MLTLEPFSEDQGRLVVQPTEGIPPISFLVPYGFTSQLTRTHVRLLTDPHPESIGGPGISRCTSDRGASLAPIRFPPDNFKHSLTLFSKSFSSFPRGTRLLSVSCQYLALNRIYRPIGAAFPKNLTRRQRLMVRQGPSTTGLSPSLAPPSRGLGPGPSLRTLLQTTIRIMRLPDFQAGVFDNDPSAGSTTETGLLATSLTANRPRRRDQNTSPNHSNSRSDGRCVQRAGT
ncbi:hypothetical protein Vadar_000440 [Vaccinium darrowii]|nr:hypothetical protein Vadar_000440 [Vaccinium darrowii]